MYITLGPTYANILVGFLSAIIDNIPIVYAVLTAHPSMDMGQWLLITLTAGVGLLLKKCLVLLFCWPPITVVIVIIRAA